MNERLASLVCGGILAGGASRRMGSPKALLTFGASTFFARARQALAGEVTRIVVLGEGPLPPGHEDLARLADAPGAPGPLGGLLAAFDFAPQAAWIILPCDLPLVSAEAVRWLLAQRRAESWAILPRLRPGAVEPLFALYEPAAHTRLRALAEGADGSLQPLARQTGVFTPEPPPRLRSAWRNVNAPEDLLGLTEPDAG